MESMALDCDSEPEIDVDEEDLEELESDLKQMAKKISEYRQTLPDHLKNTLDSVLSSHRPIVDSGLDLPSRLTITETEVAPVVSGTEEQEEYREKMSQLKETLSKNVKTIPRVVKRMRDCIERIDKLDSLSGRKTIHPAFRRRRIN